jgi:hypothetical protein
MIDNHFKRVDGIWYIILPDGDIKCNFSGSLEVAFQMGRQSIQDEMLTPKVNQHQIRAEKASKIADQKHKECNEACNNLEERLDSQGKPSETLSW